ncbi:thiamine pyrophosphate-dependent dehydrogenase E1 component subunit alpha [Longirhabdus pacifica]|uniref:thiamine pyrophosphate-dependent dehydrogenase E1 component subunit alpha n=1 Tax=Longirhabdus pacifica TaxID=2305227 RepID=UPI00100926CB|nr:thiamine pyrophosphate-dependent dehydrogenase E1 component subunit alpha [Longirhabdus pacifica]
MSETIVQENNKHRNLGITDEQVIKMYRTMVLARKFDERALLLQRSGKVNFHVSGIGHEAAQIGAAFALEKQKDYFLPYYRDYGMVLSIGMTVRDLMLSIFAKEEDITSGGRQMPGHFSAKQYHIVTGSSPVTTQVPHAVGFALAAKMKKQDFVSIVTFGDGSSNQGDFHEGLNFAAVQKLPVIFMVENNQYAISTPLHKQVACERLVDRGLGYGMHSVQVDGNDPLAVYKVVKEARERGIKGEGPTFIEAKMYRLSPHSTSDNDLAYRTKEEVEENWKKDSIPHFKTYLEECGLWTEEQELRMQEEIKQEVNEATKYAEQAPFPKPEEALTHVFKEQ